MIAQIIRHVKAFYGTTEVPACDGWDSREKQAGPHAPYLLQGAGHPSQIVYGKTCSRLARLSRQAGERRQRAGSAPARLPAGVRLRVPQQQHADPRHPGAAGPRQPGQVMVYAKLYPATLIEEYRKAVRATYLDFHGQQSDRVPDAAEWRRFSISEVGYPFRSPGSLSGQVIRPVGR